MDVWRAAVAGDAIALDDLARCLLASLSRYFRRYWRIGDADDREDYVQDTLLLVLRSLRRCRAADDTALMAWVIAIGKRVVLRDLRLRRLEVPLFSATERDPSAWHEPGAVRRQPLCPELCERDGPDEDSNEFSMSALVAPYAVRAQAVLPPHTQELLYRRLVDHASWNDIAAWAVTTPSAAKRRFQRARATLARQIMRELEQCPSGRRAQAICWLARIRSVERHRRGAE